MIYNQWYVVLDAAELRKGELVSVMRLGEKMVFWRKADGTVGCIYDRCCHRGASLGSGKLVNNHVQCPFHGFVYDDSGKVTTIPANGKNSVVAEQYKVKSYKAVDAYGFIWIWWGESLKQMPEISFFDNINKDFSYFTYADSWNVHYSRAIENQLDVVHLPFVHRTTIGRGNKTLVHGPVVFREDNKLRFYVKNVLDDGTTTPMKSKDIKDYEELTHLEFIYPNIWQNIIAEKIRVMAAFVPVDEENTVVYIRFYQSFMRLPFIRELINYIGIKYSKVILHQDKDVVMTQLPRKTSLQMEERLIPGDLPIIEYRKHRDELLKEGFKK